MLSQADNELLTRTGPGTPMGELWRRFWLPALLPEELPEPDCPPVRLRLLGEDLVAFRDSTGKVGIVQENCPHRGASLFFGRNEESGLRCVYHGWKFDTAGGCTDMPNEPAESNFKHKIRVAAYPAAEWGSLIWVYMGPSHLAAELPQFEWCTVPASHRHVAKWVQWCNFAQGYEGDLDSSHVSFLHSWFKQADSPGAQQPRRGGASTAGLAQQYRSPSLTVKETEYGLTYGARRKTDDGQYYWRVTQFLLPDWSLIASGSFPRIGHTWIPRDDESIWVFYYNYDADQPLRPDAFTSIPRMVAGTLTPFATKANDYTVDRELQRTKNYTGIANTREQDMAVVEDQWGPIGQRPREHLGTTDAAIIRARRLLLRLARELRQGREPYAATHGEVYRVRGLDVLDDEAELGNVIAKYDAEIRAPALR